MKTIINIWLKFNGLEAMKKFTKEELSWKNIYLFFIKVLEIGIFFFYIFYPFESQVIKTILGTVILARMIDLTVKGLSRVENKTWKIQY